MLKRYAQSVTMARMAAFGKWLWRAFVGYQVVAPILGLPALDRLVAVTLLVDLEQWLTNRVPDPIAYSFFVGLLFGTWIIPDIWKHMKWRLGQTAPSDIRLKYDDSCVENGFAGGVLVTSHVIRLENKSTRHLKQCQLRAHLTKHGNFNPPARWPVYLTDLFELRPLDKSVSAVAMMTPFDENGPMKMFCYVTNGKAWWRVPQTVDFLAQGCPYEISIEAVSADTTPMSINLALTHDNGKWVVTNATIP